LAFPLFNSHLSPRFFHNLHRDAVCHGWLVDHFDVNRILAAGFLLWSLVTVTTGLVRGFVLLLSMR